jgi:hypothetical protein
VLYTGDGLTTTIFDDVAVDELRLEVRMDVQKENLASIRRQFPAVSIGCISLMTALVSLLIAAILGMADPADFSVEKKQRSSMIATYIALFGLGFLIASLISAGLWLTNHRWIKGVVLALALLGTIWIGIALYGLSFPNVFFPVLLLLLFDLLLIWVLYYWPRSCEPH